MLQGKIEHINMELTKYLSPSDYKVRNNLEFPVVVFRVILLFLLDIIMTVMFILGINLVLREIFEVYSIFSMIKTKDLV